MFLWVRYVLRNVRIGVNNRDQLDALLRRIRKLPSEIEDLYWQMWKSQADNNDEYAREASIIFRIGRFFPMPLFQLMVAMRPRLCILYVQGLKVIEREELDRMCGDFANSLRSRTAGLVNVSQVKPLAPNTAIYLNWRVGWRFAEQARAKVDIR